MGDARGTVLLVEDEESVGLVVKKYFRGWKVEQAFNGREAQETLGALEEDPRLAIVDLNLPDGREFDPDDPASTSLWLVDWIRRERAAVPVVVFTAYWTPPLINATFGLGAGFLAKEDYRTALSSLAASRRAFEVIGDWRSSASLQRLCREHELTPCELRVVALALKGLRVAEIARELGRSQNTVKTQIRRILARTGCRSLRELVRRILADGQVALPRRRRRRYRKPPAGYSSSGS